MAETALIRVDNWALSVQDDGEPRVRDIDLAERAGLAQPRDIRKVIESNRAEIERFGAILTRVRRARVERQARGSVDIESTEYWLTEPQAMLLCMFLRTEKAADVREQLVRVFVAYRRGQLSTVDPDLAEKITRGLMPIVERFSTTQHEHTVRLGRVETGLDQIKNEQREQRSMLEGIVIRRELADGTKRRHVRALRERFQGRCPSCQKEHVLNASGGFVGEWDHYFARNRNAVHETWGICSPCHSRKTNPQTWIDERRAMFEAYQQLREESEPKQIVLF